LIRKTKLKSIRLSPKEIQELEDLMEKYHLDFTTLVRMLTGTGMSLLEIAPAMFDSDIMKAIQKNWKKAGKRLKEINDPTLNQIYYENSILVNMLDDPKYNKKIKHVEDIVKLFATKRHSGSPKKPKTKRGRPSRAEMSY